MTTNPGYLLLVGAGDPQYRGAAIQSLLDIGPVVVADLATRDMTWVRAMGAELLAVHEMTEATLTAAAHSLNVTVVGVLTFNEFYVPMTAVVAQHLNLPHTPVAALQACRDKSLMRGRFAACDVPSPVAIRVCSEAEAIAAGEVLGYPVVFKPIDLAGSVGVIRVDDSSMLRMAFTAICGMTDRQLGLVQGPFLVEEFVDGPEFSVEVVVRDLEPRALAVTRKSTGMEPFFEETQHVVVTADLDDGDVVEIAEQAVRAVGIVVGVAHVEVRRGKHGVQVIEVAARVGGDMISRLVSLATGHDLNTWSGHLAARLPDPDPITPIAAIAAVRFFYPREDTVVTSLEFDSLPDDPGIDLVSWEAHPGDQMLLPPRGYLSRLGYAIVTADTVQEAVRVLDNIEQRVLLNGHRLEEARAHG